MLREVNQNEEQLVQDFMGYVSSQRKELGSVSFSQLHHYSCKRTKKKEMDSLPR